ncbi:Member of major facilitator superfamily multidrug-resistance, DHA1 sub-family [Mycena venus]|uniref:Member of major facilitator superfamily multidrug-resistance, DHA1 sub-family n=1 Tax=Mycena venus TaxID=2733690 RepID=A0A8H6YKJ5_9AGAR|nr:Member of major facilitator superfamily multidrug-resistance, DHA1 sub-family [Mycena venus]
MPILMTSFGPTHNSRAVAWATGGVLGSVISLSLAEHIPFICGGNDLLRKYLYFLPYTVPATFSAIVGSSALPISPISSRKDSMSALIDQETAGAEEREVGSASAVRGGDDRENEAKSVVPLRALPKTVAASD